MGKIIVLRVPTSAEGRHRNAAVCWRRVSTVIGLHAAGRWCLKTMIEECYFDFCMVFAVLPEDDP